MSFPPNYRVTCGVQIGIVYDGRDFVAALDMFGRHVAISERLAAYSVELTKDGKSVLLFLPAGKESNHRG